MSNMMYTEAQHERELTRMETANKRWFILCIILLAMLFLSNAGWVVYESQFQDIIVEQSADSGDGGVAQVLGTAIGDVNYGQSEADGENPR